MKILCVHFRSTKTFLFSVGAIALSVLILLFGIGYAVFGIFSKDAVQTTEAGTSARSLPIYSVDTKEKKLSISFDCAWGVEHTDELLRVMEEYNVKCTFFAVQFWVEKYPEYVKKIADAGHEIGTHSRTHSYMSKLSKAKIVDELQTSAQAIETITQTKVTLFRPPYGDYNNLLIDTCKELNLYPVQWDVDSLDWKNLPAEEIALRIINGAKNGSIILCHNNGLHTAKALPKIFSALQQRGFTFVPIGELIYKENYVIDPNGKQKPVNA